jgi:hypothetical protein
MDFIVQLPKTKCGWDAIVVFVDRLSKQAHFVPTTTTASAPDIAKIFLNQIFRLHGMPSTIISDRDSKFMSKFWKAFFTLHGTKLKLSTVYHPQTDGQTEQTNRTLKQMLSIFCCYKQNDWDKYLVHAEFAYNNSQQTSMKKTPFYLNYGQHPRTASTIGHSIVPAAQDLAETISDLTRMAQDAIIEAQDQQAKYANMKHREVSYQTNDMVLLKTDHLHPDTLAQQPSKKLRAHRIGPFKIVDKIREVNYRLELPHNIRIHPVFHVSQLEAYHENPFSERTVPPPPPIQINDHEEYEVEAILDHKA